MHVNRKFLAVCRTIHIYLTMFGLVVLTLFGATGFTLNHESWFGADAPRVVEATGKTSQDLIARADSGDAVMLVENVRRTYHVSASLQSYQRSEDGYRLAFRSPGEVWDVEVDRADGATRAHAELFNAIAWADNLHRGKYSGKAWSVVIDLTAILVVLASATGVVLWIVLPKRRRLGLLALATGIAVMIALYLLAVPAADVHAK